MERRLLSPYHSQARKELITQLDRAIDGGMIDYEQACSALDAYDASLVGNFILDQTVLRPREEGYGQLTLVEEPQLEFPDGAA